MGRVVGLLILAVMVGIVAGLHWYVWRRLVRDSTVAGSIGRRAGTGVIVVGGLFMVGTPATRIDMVPFGVVRVISTVGYLWAAVLIYLLLGVLAGEVLRPLLVWWASRRKGGSDAGAVLTTTAASTRGTGTTATTGTAAATGPTEATGTTEKTGTDAEATAPNAATDTAGAGETTAQATPQEVVGNGPAAAESAGSQAVSRRMFVSRALAGATAVAAVATVGAGTYGVLKGPAVNRVTVPLRRLPAEASGFRITLVSDLHLGPSLGRGFARTVVDTINRTQPDLIAIAGDLVDGSVADLREHVAPLADLRAPHGVFFCMGNHEYYSGPDEWIEYLPNLGIRVLFNERAELPWFDIAGVDDLAAEAYDRAPDFDAALGGRDTSKPCVLLAHQPSLIHDAVDHGVDLQLSGHTHGGQLFPANFFAALANPTLAGLERYGDTQLYVTRGAGAWGPPVRVGAPSDITVIELVPDN
ncbi:metallophosphoesterase [Nocardia shimofusensis]|uniref:metallophosphoesterase n=1 Tax=Nocardia shimofusensis TaxID=228596 RepID=UPI0012EE5934|nr:metallophosphoesterase [Nocardia shimofusensis]